MAKRIELMLPAGIAVFPHLNEVDVYQPTDKNGRPMGEPKRSYNTRIKFSDEDHRKVDAMLKKAAKDLGDEDAKLPWKKNKKDGEITLGVTSGAKKKPFIVDAKNQQVPSHVTITGGSKIRLGVHAVYYPVNGGLITLYIDGVQLLELAAGFRPKFEVTDGYEAGTEVEDTTSAPTEDAEEDDLAF